MGYAWSYRPNPPTLFLNSNDAVEAVREGGDDLGTTAPWTQLDRDFVAANPYASISDTITSPHRFYRVYLVE